MIPLNVMRRRSRVESDHIGHHQVYSTTRGMQTDEAVNLGPTFKQVTYDVKTPKFKSRQSSGEVIINPFQSERSWFGESSLYTNNYSTNWSNPAAEVLKYRWENALITSFGGWSQFDFPVSLAVDVDNLVKSARIAAYAHVNKTEWMSQVSIMEWRKTAALFQQCGSALYHVIAALYARRDFLKSNLKAQANLWMTYRYAVLPTMLDLEGAIRVFSRKYDITRATARGNRSDFVQSERRWTINDTPGTWKLTTTHRLEVSARAGILYDTDSFTRALAGLGLTRPLSTVYELTKFSWMLDWWLDVGTWLDAVQPSGAQTNLASWEGLRVVQTSVSTVTGLIPSGNASMRGYSFTGSASVIRETKTRDLMQPNSLPVTPAWGSGFNQLRLADFASVILQRIEAKTGTVKGIRF